MVIEFGANRASVPLPISD